MIHSINLLFYLIGSNICIPLTLPSKPLAGTPTVGEKFVAFLISDLRFLTSDFRLLTSDFLPPTDDIIEGIKRMFPHKMVDITIQPADATDYILSNPAYTQELQERIANYQLPGLK